jgi:hypothetical protein
LTSDLICNVSWRMFFCIYLRRLYGAVWWKVLHMSLRLICSIILFSSAVSLWLFFWMIWPFQRVGNEIYHNITVYFCFQIWFCTPVWFIPSIILPFPPFLKWLCQISVLHIHTWVENTSAIFTFFYQLHLPPN